MRFRDLKSLCARQCDQTFSLEPWSTRMSLMRVAESVHTREQHIGHHRVARQRKRKQTGASNAHRRHSAEQALVSTRKRDCSSQRLDRFSILCDSQKHTTRLGIHFSACLKHSNFLNTQNLLCIQLLFTWNCPPTSQNPCDANSALDTLDIRALLLAEHCLGEFGDGDSFFGALKTRIVWMSRGPPSNGVCSKDFVTSLACSESRSAPLPAPAVLRASTSLHKGPPFTVVRLVREFMSVRVHAARFPPLAKPIPCSIRGRLTPLGRAPT